MAKLFRSALFGYNKKDVRKYVEEISSNFYSKLEERKEEIEKLKSERSELDALRAEIESKKAAISEAIISAQEKGEKIVCEARDKAQKEYDSMQKKIADENQKLIKIRREVLNIRRNAIKTLNNITIDTEDSEEGVEE